VETGPLPPKQRSLVECHKGWFLGGLQGVPFMWPGGGSQMTSKQETSTQHRTGVKPNFDQTMFTASMRDLRFTASGDVLLTMVVPYSDKHLVIPVSDAYGINLDVDIRRKRAKQK
jgi:hypothetical protein